MHPKPPPPPAEVQAAAALLQRGGCLALDHATRLARSRGQWHDYPAIVRHLDPFLIEGGRDRVGLAGDDLAPVEAVSERESWTRETARSTHAAWLRALRLMHGAAQPCAAPQTKRAHVDRI